MFYLIFNLAYSVVIFVFYEIIYFLFTGEVGLGGVGALMVVTALPPEAGKPTTVPTLEGLPATED